MTPKGRMRRRFYEKAKPVLRAEFQRMKPTLKKKWWSKGEFGIIFRGLTLGVGAKRMCNRLCDVAMETIAEELVEHGHVEIYGVVIVKHSHNWHGGPVMKARACVKLKAQLKKKRDDDTPNS